MITVGIIGILAALTVPAYQRQVRKAKQSEAKVVLAAIFTLEKAFHAEYAAFAPSFDAIGYSPEGKRNYKVGLCQTTGSNCDYSGTIDGYVGGFANCYYDRTETQFATASSNSPHWVGCNENPYYGSNNPQSFIAVGNAQLCHFSTCPKDVWTINHQKILSNAQIGF